MKKYFTTIRRSTLLALMLVFVSSSVWAEDPPTVIDGAELKVTAVLSGQEIEGKLASGEVVAIRILGINCPDDKKGDKATRLVNKLIEGQTVKLESTKEGFPLLIDNRGRLVAYIRLSDGRDLAATMLEQGQCTVAMWRISHPRKLIYASLDR